MAADDDLEFNPFYQALLDKFSSRFQAAQDNCNLVCIPQTSSLNGVVFDIGFVESHILKPSPYFKGQYVSTDRNSRKALVFEDTCLRTVQGFIEERCIKILGEEIGYNKEFKPFRIVVTEGPLVDVLSKVLHRSESKKDIDVLQPKTSAEDCKKFLFSFEEHQKVLDTLAQQIQQFNSNYMILSAYLEETTTRLKQLWCQTTQELVAVNCHPLCADARFRDNVSLAVESHLLSCVHQKVFPVVRQRCQKDDDRLTVKFRQLDGISAQQLGVHPDFCCPLPAAVVELANLDGLHTPMEKLVCLKTTLDVLSEEVNAHLLSQPNTTDKDIPCLTSDDLIPLLVTVLCQAHVPHLASTLYYIDQFHWAASSKDDLSFSLVTSKAAVEYISTTDFNHLRPTHNSNPKEISIEELLGPTQKVSISGSAAEGGESRSQRSSRFDRQLDRITQMFKAANSDFGELSHSSPATRQVSSGAPVSRSKSRPMVAPNIIPPPGQPRNQLGDFLSSLKDDVLDSSFGKLS